jgi:hypothetical protein
MKTNELTGAALDWAVACVEKLPMDLLVWEYGLPVVKRTLLGHTDTLRCEFSTNWSQGGPIIEREGISIESTTMRGKGGNFAWRATRVEGPAVSEEYGITPLIAAMRCYVASCLGDEVEVPEELR